MRAWRINEPNSIAKEEMDSQPVGPGCVKIKILETAIAQPDHMIYQGKIPVNFPIIPGRQCVAIVSEVGESVIKLQRGNKVLAVPNISCHECAACHAGKPNECPNILTFGYNEDGFMRDFAVLNANDLYLLPDRVHATEALYVDYIDIAIHTILKLNLEKGQHLVIMGATDLGIILAQVAIYYQTIPILVDPKQSNLNLAESLGIYYSVNTVDQEPYKKIFTITGGKMADALAYTASSELPLQQCFDYIKKGGGIALAGYGNSVPQLTGDFSVILNRQLNVFGISGEMKNIPSAINMLANKSINVLPLIGESIGFEDVEAQFQKGMEAAYSDEKTIVRI